MAHCFVLFFSLKNKEIIENIKFNKTISLVSNHFFLDGCKLF